MTGKQEVRLAGFGGQGIVLAGHILGKAASLFENKNAVFTQSYGPEARGGACNADVVISEDPIYYPKVSQPNVLVFMSQKALTTYGRSISPETVVILDEDLVSFTDNSHGTTVYRVPATSIAEQMGKRIVANIVMLGSVVSLTELVTYESARQAVLSSIPSGTEVLNMSAFDKGYEYGSELRQA